MDFPVQVEKDGQSLHARDEDSDEEQGRWTLPPESGDRGDVIVFLPSAAGHS